MNRERTRYGLRHFGAVALALTTVAAWATPASALTLQTLKTGKCVVANTTNIGSGTGGASTNGYTIHPNINSITGVLNITTAIGTPPMELPANGVICVSSITCTGVGVLKFNKNNDNTPVYLLVEGDVTLTAGCDIDVSGTDSTLRYGIGMDQVGGVGGPGGSDGGSCDFTFSNPIRAGEGIGPGGGGASTTGPAGGGASPVSPGETGKTGGTFPGVGGAAYSQREHRIMHGGSGGGCGSSATSTSPQGGGGGGGVLVLAAGGTIHFNHGTSIIYAKGGSGQTYGGGGGGGVVRLVATKISAATPTAANGYIDVTRGGICESWGGCGGDGLIKIESPDASGSWIANSIPQTALYYGTVQEIFPDPAQRPVLTIASVVATFNGVSKTVTRQQQDPSVHIHTVPGVFLEAPSTPAEQTITVNLTSNNIPFNAPVKVRLNTVYNAQNKRSIVATAVTPGGSSGSGSLTWTAQIIVPGGLELGTIEAWVDNVCTPGTPGC